MPAVAVLTSASLPPQVIQVLNADAIVVKLNSGDHKTIHLSSIRPPRLEGDSAQVTVGTRGGEGAVPRAASVQRLVRAAIAGGHDHPWMETPPREAPLLPGLTPPCSAPPFSPRAGGLGGGLSVHSDGGGETDASLIPCLSFPLGLAGAVAALCSGEEGDPRFRSAGAVGVCGGLRLGAVLAAG